VTAGLCTAPFVPYINLYQSLGVADIILVTLFLYEVLFKGLLIRISGPLLLAFILPLIGFISLCINALPANFYIFGQSMGYVIKLVYISLIVAYLPLKIKRVGPEAIIKGIFIGCLISLAWAWYIWILNPNTFFGVPMLHVYGQGEYDINRNFLGFFSSLALCINLTYLTSPQFKGIKKIMLGVIFLGVLFSVIFSFSKGTWVASLIPIIYYIIAFVLFKAKNESSKFIPIIKCIISAVLIAFLLSIYFIRFDFLDLVSRRMSFSGYTLYERVTYLEDSLSIMFHHPLFGVGPKYYAYATNKAGYIQTSDPHNAWLWIGSELGLLALATVIIISFYALYKSFRYAKASRLNIPTHLIIICLLINGFMSGLLFSMKHFWICISILIALGPIQSSKACILINKTSKD
jgi:hypothetical protein